MKKFLIALLFFSACSATESSGWISNLLLLNNVNYVADKSGTITMDGFTFTLHSARGATTAIYAVHIGEFAKKEQESIGYVRFDILDAALSDPRIREPLIRYQMRTTPEDAAIAPKMNTGELLAIPQEVTDERFLRTVRNFTHRLLQTNGASMGVEVPSISATEGWLYMMGTTASDGTNIFFEEVKTRDAVNLPPSYYRNGQWRFVKAVNNVRAVYQKVPLIYTDPGNNPDGAPYHKELNVHPLRENTALALESKFIGVENKSDGLYFYYPTSGVDSYFSSSTNVIFTNSIYSVKISRPLTAGDAL